MKIRTLIIDDEKLARSRLRRMLDASETIEIVGEASDGQEGLVLVESTRPDLIFLDIKMPHLSGFEMLTKLEKSPYIIFTTAYDQYALQAFEENTIDYLLKPISQAKLDRAISKVETIVRQGSAAPFDLERLLKAVDKKQSVIRRFSVKVGDRIFIIPDHEIHFFKAEEKYTFLQTAKDEYIIAFTLKELEDKLDPDLFCRVHRSFIINLEKIESIHKWFGGRLKLMMRNGQEILVSQNYVNEFKQRIHYL
ncbi:MAG: LytR/AlgR family response regulator transcription factor [Candidatus Zhuqueibacterota bacterium]